MSATTADQRGGILVSEDVVRPEWIDINGHMNVAYYVLAFDYGVDAMWSKAGVTDEYVQTQKQSTFAVECHVTYRQELCLGDPFRIATQILAIDSKRLHQFQRMYHGTEGYLAATAEWMNLHVSLESRRVCPWPDNIREAFIDIAKSQGDTGVSRDIGRVMQVAAPMYAVGGYAKEE